MLSLKNSIRAALAEALKKIGVDTPPQIAIECPENPEHGHYATPIAMVLARILKKAPQQIAQDILNHIDKSNFEKIEIAGAGYINFTFSNLFLEERLAALLSAENPGANNTFKGKKLLVEFVSANPTGPLHIGHGRWAAVGDTLARFIRHCGGEVSTEFYVNDAGVQISNLKKSVEAVSAGKNVPEDGYHGAYIKELAEECNKTGQMPEILMRKAQEETLKNFRVEFDSWFSEKSLYTDGSLEESLKKLKDMGSAYEHEGALWFKSSEFGDDKDRVLVKSDGSYTYFAADIAYHYDKIKRGFYHLIDILGADHHGYVERIKASVKIFGGELTVLLGQLVNLFRDGELVRMSKRTGDIISLDEVIEEIGVDAARYLLIRRPMTVSIDFDLSKAKNQNDDNPVFYVQYAHARICSIIRNSTLALEAQGMKDEYEKLLLLEILKFEDILIEISYDYDLQKIPAYLEKLASVFHSFYRQCRVIGDPSEKFRLALCEAAKKTLATGLNLTGVHAPEAMH